jgi:hypothetical protein
MALFPSNETGWGDPYGWCDECDTSIGSDLLDDEGRWCNNCYEFQLENNSKLNDYLITMVETIIYSVSVTAETLDEAKTAAWEVPKEQWRKDDSDSGVSLGYDHWVRTAALDTSVDWEITNG